MAVNSQVFSICSVCIFVYWYSQVRWSASYYYELNKRDCVGLRLFKAGVLEADTLLFRLIQLAKVY